ncbi:TonB-dependent receptor [Lysobacter sp.]|uniref:TonB-dependent receptor n=1 Tax=Lysobacter sp. TaxID=72226 RepID=UPI002D3663AE|nr:TonB-dependent receptor [Lysobacter sp.]HZX77558.1 TonB-dependent receptor [Lysobacter sp.]
MTSTLRRTPGAHPLALAVAFSLSAACAPALASGDQPTTLDRIQVQGVRQPLSAPASAGTRLQLTVMETPASVTVIDRDTLDRRDVRNTQEALYAIPGLTVVSPPGNGNAVTYRGFSGSQISQLFNGIDLQYATIAARPVDAWIYERVEAIGGPSSFLYGAGAVGGAINYVTRLPRLDADSAQAMLGYGSFDSRVLAAGINHRLGGDGARNAVRADASWSGTDGWADRNDRESLVAAVSLLSQITPALTHTLALEHQKEDSARPYWGTPVLTTPDGRMKVLPGTQTRNYNVADGYYKQDVDWVRSLLAWQPSDATRLRNTLYYYDALRDYRNVESYRFNADATVVIRSGALLQRHDQQVVGDKLEWSHDGTLAGRRSQWNAGLDVSYNRQTRFPLSIAGDIDTVPIDSVTPGSFFDVRGAAQVFTPQRTNRVRTQALFVENLTQLTQRLSLLTGLRHDRIELDVENHQAATPSNPARFTRDYDPTTGRIALDFAFSPGASVYAQYATAADPPAGVLSTASLSQVQDFDLSRGRQFEVGSKFQRADGRAFATLAAFHIVRENLAIADPERPGQTVPVGEQSSRGVEVAFGLETQRGLSLQGNLAWVEATLDDFFETQGGVPVSRAGNRPANTPSTVANLWADYRFAPAWSAGIDVRAVSSRYANAANTIESAGYALLGANLRWNLDARTQLTLRARNLGDRTYIAYALSPTMAYLGEPRSLEVSLRREF